MSDNAFSFDPELIASFAVEVSEHLEMIEQDVLILEEDDADHVEAVASLFRSFHTIKGTAAFLGLDDFHRIAASGEQLLDEHRQSKKQFPTKHINVLLAAGDLLGTMVKMMRECLKTGADWESPGKALDTICRQLEDALTIEVNEEDNILSKPGAVFISPAVQKKIAEQKASNTEANVESVENGKAAYALEDEAEEVQQQADKEQAQEFWLAAGKKDTSDAAPVSQPKDSASESSPVRKNIIALQDETVRVSTRVLDELVDGIGELVIVEAMVTEGRRVSDKISDIYDKLEQLTKITRGLQDMGTSLRMVPIRPVFKKMTRLVRDLSNKLGRPVRLETDGEDTQLDKSVVDRISDPLMHMIRNAMDHGIEDPEERHFSTKPAEACIRLIARHRGGGIQIEITDDGRGIDPENVRNRAIERGIIERESELSERECYDLLFAPGFSTAEVVTDVSGRGVGMDVVKREVQHLRGDIDISSEIGKGTSMVIRLPLTMAIIDGMVVRIGAERYVIPILSIISSQQPNQAMLHSVLRKGQMLKHQDELLPIFRLFDLFDVQGAQSDPLQSIMVIIEEDGKRVALQVDELLGQQQIVIKSFSTNAVHPEGIAGAAVMPDGMVGLIVDVPGAVRIALEGHVTPNDQSQAS
ncbi:MAG: chemotaxis protein CheA [Planctomycetes bacterium]|nr:chemotaxis protein CheA [Planctomycetota bacterium]